MRLSAWSLRSQATRRAPLRCMPRRPRRRSWVRWRCTASSSSRWSGLVVLVHLLLLLLLRLLLLLLLLLEQVEGAMAALMQLATLDLPGCMEAGLAAAVVRSMHSRLAGGWLQFLCAPARSKVPPRRCYTSLACLGGATACSPGLPRAASPGSWLRCALRASCSAAQRPVGGCGEARPKLRTPRRSTPRRTDALVVPVDGRGGRRRGAPCRRCCRGPRTRATHRGGRCLRRLLPLILTLTLASPSPDPSSNPNQVSDDCGDPYGVPELPAKLQAPSTPAAPYRPLPPLTAPRHARRPSPPHAIPSPPRAAHAARAAFDR